MIELKNDCLVFSFPEVHPKATLKVEFQRTLRIPDDGRDYPLPPGLGEFPMRHIYECLDYLDMEWDYLWDVVERFRGPDVQIDRPA